jgi:AraC-like DNA-binding protein
MGLSNAVLTGRTGRLERIWTASSDSATSFSSVAKVRPGIAFRRVGGTTTVHLRGVETRATTLPSPKGAEYFGAELRLGAYLPEFPPARLANLQDALLPTLPDGRIRLAGREWEMPTPENLDVFMDRLERAGLLVFDPRIEGLLYDDAGSERTAQSRFVRAVGLSRRKLRVIGRAHEAVRRLLAGASIGDVVSDVGFYDQSHLTRTLRLLIGYTPTQLIAGGPPFLDLGPAVPYKTARNGRP